MHPREENLCPDAWLNLLPLVSSEKMEDDPGERRQLGIEGGSDAEEGEEEEGEEAKKLKRLQQEEQVAGMHLLCCYVW